MLEADAQDHGKVADELREHMGLAVAGRDTLKVSHILIKHSGSRKAASRLDPTGTRIRQRSLAAARASLIAVRRRLVAAIADMQADSQSERNAPPRAAAAASEPGAGAGAHAALVSGTALQDNHSDTEQRAQQGGAGGIRGAHVPTLSAAQAVRSGAGADQGGDGTAAAAAAAAAAARLGQVEQLFAAAARNVSDCIRRVACRPPPALSTSRIRSLPDPALPALPAGALPDPHSPSTTRHTLCVRSCPPDAGSCYV